METLLEALHKAVLRVQPEAHGPQDLCVLLAQVVKCVHELVEVRVGVHHISRQYVVKTVRGTRESLIQILTPYQLSDLKRRGSSTRKAFMLKIALKAVFYLLKVQHF